jgi:hypothetical protein
LYQCCAILSSIRLSPTSASTGTVIPKKLHEQDVVITIEKCLQENKLLEFAKLHKITGIINDIRFLIVTFYVNFIIFALK